MTVKDNLLTFPRFDEFDLRIELCGPYQEYAHEPATYLITQAVYINGENLAPNNPIDLAQLCKSCQLSGEFFIVTCGCGDPGCAGIDDGIRVTHLDDRVVWDAPTPMSYRDMTEEEVGAALENRTYRKFTFRPEAYLAAVQKGLREAKAMLFDECQPVECSPYGMTPEGLLALNPVVFSERGAPLGCGIVGRKIMVDRHWGWISIDGIPYRLRELPVPDHIKALDDWSEWEPKACGDGYAFNYHAAPRSVVRRRIRALAEYLSSIAVSDCQIDANLGEIHGKGGPRWDRHVVLRGYGSTRLQT